MIRLTDVSIVRGSTLVASPFTLAVGPGESVAVLGRTGSGKTSLIEVIAGVLTPTTGRAERGEPVAATAHQPQPNSATGHRPLRIGYAPAEAVAWPVMRMDEFLEMVGLAAGLVGKPLRLAVDRGLAFADSVDLRQCRLDRLSDGQRKRLLLAAALLHDPDLLVLDDPLRSLDLLGGGDVERVVEDLALAGGCVVAALNDGRVGACWSRVLVLDQGLLFDTAAVQGHPLDSWPTWSRDCLASWRQARTSQASE
jgi:ABC-type multidrug transport system ATPase subunit